MKKLIIVLVSLLLIAAPAHAKKKVRFFGCLTGGTTGCLDAESVVDLQEGEGAIVFMPGATPDHRVFVFDDDSVLAEDGTTTVRPDDFATQAQGVWILADPYIDGTGVVGVDHPSDAGNVIVIKNKWDATTAPVGTNDIDEGYVVGSMWWDVTNDRLYACIDNTDDNAAWLDLPDGGTYLPLAGGVMTGDLQITNGLDIRLGSTTSGHEFSIQVYDNDGTAWDDIVNYANGNTPTATYTEKHDFSGAAVQFGTNFGIPSAANPTTDAAGEISVDISDGGQVPVLIEAYDSGGTASRIVGVDVRCESKTILEPDSAVDVEANIPLKQFVAEGYPHGVSMVSIHVGTDGTDVTDDSINFERWTGEDDGSPDTMEAIDLTGVDNAEDDGTIANNPAADDYFVADITGWNDDIPLIIITYCYRITPGD